MALRTPLVAFAALLLLADGPAHSRAPQSGARPGSARLVHVPAFVADSRGQRVDVELSTFEVFEDNIPQPTTSLTKPDAPLDVTLAIDISSSMEAVLPEVRLALNDLLGRLRDIDMARLFTFSEKFAEVPRGRTWSATLDGLIPRGAAALYDGVLEAANRVGSGAMRRALVVLTDSEDQNSRASLVTVTERVLMMDATLVVVFLGVNQSPREVREAFDQLAVATGGRIVRVNRGQLRRTFEELGAELTNLHLITYQTIRDTVDSRVHKVDVRTPGRRDVRVRARTQYMDTR